MEAWDPSLKANTTFSHPWAASPAFSIPRSLFGIRPTTPGFGEFRVRPQPGGLEWAHITVPTRFGQVGAAFVVVGGRTDVAVHVPSGSTATVHVPAGPGGGTEVYVDGQSVTAAPTGSYLAVSVTGPGCHVLSTAPDVRPPPGDRLLAACPPS